MALTRRSLLRQLAVTSAGGALLAGGLAGPFLRIASAQTIAVPADVGLVLNPLPLADDLESRGLGTISNPILRGQRTDSSRFTLMFPRLPAYTVPDATLVALAETMRDRGPGAATGDNLFYATDGTFISAFEAGLTYVGQFLDHDMSLDGTPLAQATADPFAIRNFRQPALNLDSVYQPDPLFGNVPPVANDRFLIPLNVFGVSDVPRNAQGFAIIGDFRNDENLLIQPVHLAVMRFHNALLDLGVAHTFAQARQLTRFYYQWAIVTEFLPAVIGQELTDDIVRLKIGLPARPMVTTRFFHGSALPLEFSVAAYRLHTLVRNNYNIRAGTRIGIFNSQPLNLVGGRPVPANLVQQSDLFFRTATSPAFDPPNTSAGAQSFNVARRFDASISPQLYNLPAFALPNSPEFNSLPVRNLIRGARLELAAGQDVAGRMGMVPLTNEELNANAANIAGGTHGLTNPDFGGKAPLWFYLNKEAEILGRGRMLGPTGGRLVGEVIGSLLMSDADSFINSPDKFSPQPPVAVTPGQFTFADLFRFAGSL